MIMSGEADLLLEYMAIIVKARDTSQADRTFAASIIRQSRRSHWQPSWRQMYRMRRIK